LKRWLRAALALVALSLAASCIACSPVYVVKAGIAEVEIEFKQHLTLMFFRMVIRFRQNSN
jgi:hypothetical protein